MSTRKSSDTLVASAGTLPPTANHRLSLLAQHKDTECYFDLRLTRVELTTFHGKLAHQLEFKLDFARPFDINKRIRAATISVEVIPRRRSRTSPNIVGINPEASLVKIADHEITNGQSIGVNAGTPAAAPASMSASANFSWGDKTTFAGNRLIHGFLVSETEAQWKMYEEPRSKSGLPPSLSLLMLVESESDRGFRVKGKVTVRRWSGRGLFGMVKHISAPSAGEKPVLSLVDSRATKEVRQNALDASDEITNLVEETESKAQIMARVVTKVFPQLENTSTFKAAGAVLALQSLNGTFERKELKVPFYPEVLVIGQHINARTTPTPTNGFFKSQVLSQKHAEVWADSLGRVWIRDTKSEHGTTVNGEQLWPGYQSSEPRELYQRNRLEFGTNGKYESDPDSNNDDDNDSHSNDENDAGRNSDEDQTLNDHKISATVEYVGLQARREIEAKIKLWESTAVTTDQRQLLSILKDAINRRLDALRLPPFEGVDDHFDDRQIYADLAFDSAESEPAYSRRAVGDEQGYMAQRSRYTEAPRPGGSAPATGYLDRLLSKNKPPSGEEALSNHRAVGRDWSEAKL